jgi:hypothetical protein
MEQKGAMARCRDQSRAEKSHRMFLICVSEKHACGNVFMLGFPAETIVGSKIFIPIPQNGRSIRLEFVFDSCDPLRARDLVWVLRDRPGR